MQVQLLHTSTSCMEPMVGTKSCIHLPISHIFLVEKKLKQKKIICMMIIYNYTSMIAIDGYEVILNAQRHNIGHD